MKVLNWTAEVKDRNDPDKGFYHVVEIMLNDEIVFRFNNGYYEDEDRAIADAINAFKKKLKTI